MLEVVFWGCVLRVCQSLLQAAPYILVGLFIAGILRRFLGQQGARRLFGGDSGVRSLLQAWGVGMLLPVCSLGVIPVVREMRSCRLPGGTILAFALAAPLFNPLSLLYGLTLSKPLTILSFAACSLVVITVAGIAWDRLCPDTSQAEPALPTVAFGLKRLSSLVVFAAREISGASALYMLCGLVGVALLAAVLPHGSLQRSVNQDNVWAPLLMTVVAVPAYATPMLAMSQLGMMFQHGNSVGAAFALLTLGAGMNLGLFSWTVSSYGMRRAGLWIGGLTSIVLALSYSVDRPLRPAGIEPADHTHAFDIYCQPFTAGVRDLPGTVWTTLAQNAQLPEVAALLALSFLLAGGLALRIVDPRQRLEGWLERPPVPNGPRGRFDLIVPAPVVGGVILAGIVAFSIVGCFAYYPPPEEVLRELYVAKGEALGSALAGERGHSEHWIAVMDDWTRKLQVGVYLRRGELSDYHRMKARLLREKLELLRHEVEEADRAEIQRLVVAVDRAYRRMRDAYSLELSP